MFTGIVAGVGRVVAVSPRRGGRRIEIEPPKGFGRLAAGESVCVSGVCLTAIEPGRVLVADLSGETLRRSTLGSLAAGDSVNLERALRWGDRLSGHFVMGHVDAVARLISVSRDGNSWTLRVAIPPRALLAHRREGVRRARRRQPDGRRPRRPRRSPSR